MIADITLKRGNRLPGVVAIQRDERGPVDLTGYTAVFKMINVLTGAVEINDAAATVAVNPTFTADASTNTLSSPAHGIVNGQDVTLKSSDTLPGNLSAQRTYYAINVGLNTLQLAEVLDGSAVDIQNAGTGTHTLLIGKVTYDWLDADTDTAGTYQGHIETIKDGQRLTFPNDRHLLIEILSDLTGATDRTKAIKAVMDRVRMDAEPKISQGAIELEVDRAQLARVWQSNTAYKVGDVVVPQDRNGFAYVCVQPGTSKSSSFNYHDWPQDAGYVFGDGDTNANPALVWECVGHDRFNAGIFGCETNIYDISRAARECWLLKARYTSDMIDDAGVSFSDIRKNCLEHAGEFRPFKRQAQLVRV